MSRPPPYQPCPTESVPSQQRYPSGYPQSDQRGSSITPSPSRADPFGGRTDKAQRRKGGFLPPQIAYPEVPPASQNPPDSEATQGDSQEAEEASILEHREGALAALGKASTPDPLSERKQAVGFLLDRGVDRKQKQPSQHTGTETERLQHRADTYRHYTGETDTETSNQNPTGPPSQNQTWHYNQNPPGHYYNQNQTWQSSQNQTSPSSQNQTWQSRPETRSQRPEDQLTDLLKSGYPGTKTAKLKQRADAYNHLTGEKHTVTSNQNPTWSYSQNQPCHYNQNQPWQSSQNPPQYTAQYYSQNTAQHHPQHTVQNHSQNTAPYPPQDTGPYHSQNTGPYHQQHPPPYPPQHLSRNYPPNPTSGSP